MQIAKSGLDKRISPRYNAKHEGKGVFECKHSEALFLFLNTIKRQWRLSRQRVLPRGALFVVQEENYVLR